MILKKGRYGKEKSPHNFLSPKPLDKRKKIMYNTYDLAVNIRE